MHTRGASAFWIVFCSHSLSKTRLRNSQHDPLLPLQDEELLARHVPFSEGTMMAPPRSDHDARC